MDTVRVSTLVAMACLFAIGCVVGLIAGRARRERATRFGLFNKPKRTKPAVLVPPGPVPRLIPSDSPNVTRAKQTRAPVRRQTPTGATRAGMIDYIAAFAGPERSEGTRIDYLLPPDENTANACDTADSTSSTGEAESPSTRDPASA